MATTIYASNDKPLQFTFQKIDEDSESNTFGKKVALTSGDCTAFLAASDEPDAEAVENSPEWTLQHVARGKWLLVMDATDLTDEFLAPLVEDDAKLYLIVEHSSGIRIAEELTYEPTRTVED